MHQTGTGASDIAVAIEEALFFELASSDGAAHMMGTGLGAYRRQLSNILFNLSAEGGDELRYVYIRRS